MSGPHPWSRNSPVPPLVWDWVPPAPLPPVPSEHRAGEAAPGCAGRCGQGWLPARGLGLPQSAAAVAMADRVPGSRRGPHLL